MDFSTIFDILAEHHKELRIKLLQASIQDSPREFIRKTFFIAGYATFAAFIIFFLFFSFLSLKAKILILLFFLPACFIFVFNYFLRYPDVKIKKLEREINKEIIFAGRFLIIELESGISLYKAMINMISNYEVVGQYFKEIIDRVSMGTTMEEAMNLEVETIPSSNLRKVFWQMLNSLKTGSDIVNSLDSVIEQIIREQQIEVQEYGRKLNPLAMFYMMIAVIVPSLGMTMLVVIATFIGIKLSLAVLLSITGLLGFVQFMFVAMIKSARPPVEL
ncbi:type II secretion system F family protein [Candidatus Woesearchaeota archaeon]|nr:type II secretion system F family protein [Candidatus Woesearchaeota archaeon]